MNKVSTAVTVGIVCVVMLGVVIYLNRDKFHSSSATLEVPATEA